MFTIQIYENTYLLPIRYCMAYQKEKSWRKLKFKKNKKELHKQI